MDDSQLKALTHANTGDSVIVDLGMLVSHWASSAQKCTILQAVGGALLPVKESADLITESRKAFLNTRSK